MSLSLAELATIAALSAEARRALGRITEGKMRQRDRHGRLVLIEPPWSLLDDGELSELLKAARA